MSFIALDWIHQTNIYEVNLRQYTKEGTCAAFARELPRLRDMGVETLWFMPITPISVFKRIGSLGSYYSCSDYTALNPEFGSLDDFKALVKAAHGLGFKILIDWVANHTGWDHRWTKEHPEFYKKDATGHFYDSNGWEDVIDLDYGNESLRQAVIDAMLFWVRECDIDGFRCDMAMLVPLDFWVQARTRLDQEKKLCWLAECEEISYQGVFDCHYTWKFLHRMEAYWKKQTGISGLDDVLQDYDRQYAPEMCRVFFTSNHDENSHSGSEYERLGDAALGFAVLCSTWNGIPLVYSGQELPNYKRLLFFDKDQIDWTGHCALHDFYKNLFALRKRNLALRAGDPGVMSYRLKTDSDDRLFAFLREKGSSQVLVFLNLSAVQLHATINDLKPQAVFKNIFTGTLVDFSQVRSIDLAAWSYSVFEK